MSQIVQSEKKTSKIAYENQRKRDHELVKGIFKFYEVPNGIMSFSYKKYKEDQVMNFTFVDGQIYTIPRMVARHLVNDCWYPEYDHVKSEDYKTTYAIKNKVHRCGFQSLEFMDEDLKINTVLEVAQVA